MTAEHPPADETGCSCLTHLEHAALISRVDASYLQDADRARERHGRTSSVLRARVLAGSNGHAKAAA